MTRAKRFRSRLKMIRAGMTHARRDLHLGFTLQPIAGGAPEEGEKPPAESETKPGNEPKKPEEKPKEKPEKPPWESEDQFDPDRAWQLIQDVRSDVEHAKLKARTTETELEEARLELKKHADAQKTDQEKLEGRATESETKAQEAEGRTKLAEAETARLRVALRKGLDETQAKRLVGETEEELEADADALLESFGGKKSNEETPRRPRERTRPGAVPKVDPDESDPRKLAEGLPSYS